MNKRIVFLLLAVISPLLCTAAHSQNIGAYLIPRQIYVGDQAVMILPLPSTTQDSVDIVLTDFSYDFPFHPDIDFHKITLQRRISGSRLTIEFAAFVPGFLEFPVIEIGGYRFTGLNVTVNSLVDRQSSIELSGLASSLAMPGTGLMIYGAMAGLIIFILLSIWFILKGRLFLSKWNEKWKYWKLFISMKLTEKRLHRSILKEGDKRIILDELSDKFRIFLSYLTGSNCRSMTAREFKNFTLNLPENVDLKSSYFHNFFSKCDELRFSGAEVNSQDILRLLADLRFFLGVLAKTGRKKPEATEEKRPAV
ncbi:MAG: hypothetical protein LBI12_08220 [Treponema sp.]|jgi:hypothetical protein|nr:hypothetical protein [Treponema sp.]